MEAVISAVLGEIVSRAISIVAEKWCEQTTAEEDLQRLRQLLLRISTVVEEAEGRRVQNRVMVRHISTMKEQMFRGYYLLDTFRCKERKIDHDEVRRFSFAQSKFNPAKRFRRLVSNTQIESPLIGRESIKELKQAALVLESMVVDMKEFVRLLGVSLGTSFSDCTKSAKIMKDFEKNRSVSLLKGKNALAQNCMMVSRASDLCDDLEAEEDLLSDENLERPKVITRERKIRKKKSYDKENVRRSNRVRFKPSKLQ
jgi:hypothetical protein